MKTSTPSFVSTRSLRLGLLLAVFLFGLTLSGPAQEPTPIAPGQKKSEDTEKSGTKTPPSASKEQEAYENFWYGENPLTRHAAAVQVAGALDPWLKLSLAFTGNEFSLWGSQDTIFGPEQAPELNHQWFKYLPNNQAFLGIPEGNPYKLPLAERLEWVAFTQTLVYTGRTPAEAFPNSAKANAGLSWAKLATEPENHQGKVVTLKGWLKHLVRKEAPPQAVTNFVPHYYEGWFHTGFGGKNPVFITFTELPEGIEPGENLDHSIQFSGYFIKQFRYLTEKGPTAGLWVMARTFEVVTKGVANIVKAPPITEKLLKAIKDDREFPKTGIKDPGKITDQEKLEIEAYTEALLHASKTPAKAFANSAKENDWVTYSQLFQEPWKYRGQVVSFKGQLKRLRKMETTIEAARQGVDYCYEGWVFSETKYGTPVCVVFAQLPAGVALGENIDYTVRFDGYFFKRYLYLDSDRKAKKTLFLFAPTFEVLQPEAGQNSPGISMIFMVLVGIAVLAGVTLLLIIGMNWWFRRGDAAIQARLAAARASFLTAGDLQDEPLTAKGTGKIEKEPGQPFEAGHPAAPPSTDQNRPRF